VQFLTKNYPSSKGWINFKLNTREFGEIKRRRMNQKNDMDV
jgi:hypothetical protein